MKNQYNYQYQSPKHNYLYSIKKKEQISRLKKYKILIIILKRAVRQSLQQCFFNIIKFNTLHSQAIKKIIHINQLNLNSVIKLSIQKLKQNTTIQKSKEFKLKNLNTLLKNKQIKIMQQLFSKIRIFGLEKNNQKLRKFDHLNIMYLINKLQKLFFFKKYQYFQSFIISLNYKKKIFIISSFISFILKNMLKRHLNYFYSQIKQNYLCIKQCQKSTKIKQQSKQIYQLSIKQKSYFNDSQNKEMKHLKSQLQQMKIQLKNKNDLIQKLQDQNTHLKSQQYIFNSFSQDPSNQFNLNKSRSRSIKKINLNDSCDSNIDFSNGSILGYSFTTLSKSRSKSVKKNQQQDTISDCKCGWKQKYFKFKNINQSLKNQLQIVKQQLQVAKDLNDHFTNQIRQYFNGQKKQFEVDHIKNEFLNLQKERDELKMKVTKYQNHITRLKSEFKIKIQQLYRKVKKER